MYTFICLYHGTAQTSKTMFKGRSPSRKPIVTRTVMTLTYMQYCSYTITYIVSHTHAQGLVLRVVAEESDLMRAIRAGAHGVGICREELVE